MLRRFFALWMIAIFSLVITSCGGGCDEFKNDYLIPLEVNGVIIDKYIDKGNHSYRKIVIEGGRIISPSIFADNLYDYVREGDYLSKQKGSSTFKVRRNGETVEIKADCKGFR